MAFGISETHASQETLLGLWLEEVIAVNLQRDLALTVSGIELTVAMQKL